LSAFERLCLLLLFFVHLCKFLSVPVSLCQYLLIFVNLYLFGLLVFVFHCWPWSASTHLSGQVKKVFCLTRFFIFLLTLEVSKVQCKRLNFVAKYQNIHDVRNSVNQAEFRTPCNLYIKIYLGPKNILKSFRCLVQYLSRIAVSSVADPGCLSRIPDPGFFPFRIPDLGSRIPDPKKHGEVKKFFYFICFLTFL
jgi:hypothetical protein